jgi:DNA topoisomerase-2
MKLTDFFNTDYVDQASYDNLRKIASVVDGQKNGARKVLYTVLEKNIKTKLKVSQLSSKAAEYAEYLHGDLAGPIINLAQGFPGTNNIPLLQAKGNFGTLFTQGASAARYIHTYGSDEFFELFKKEDIPILTKQFFEGQQIEPVHYVPTIPMLLINGSEGVSSGFAQKILPRDPKVIKKYIQASVAGKRTPKLTPFYRGFNGTIEPGINPGQWYIKGAVQRLGINKIQITELPIGYDLKGYLKVLDKLEDVKIIQSYRDKSENDNFLFDVTVPSKSLKSWDDEMLMVMLKLVKTVTENYTVIDESNKIRVHTCAEDILDHFMRVKLEYMDKRKAYLQASIAREIEFDTSKYHFIQLIVKDELKINKRKKKDIVLDLDTYDTILQNEGNYDYLLGMNILSLTEERMKKIKDDILAKTHGLDKLNKTTPEELWLEDINGI